MLYRLIVLNIFLATAMPETKVKICSSAGSYTLSPWLASVRDNVTMTGVSWKCWNTDSKSWTEVFHWDDCKGCFMLLKTLADDSLPQCSSDGNLIVDRLKGWPAGTFTRYWVESRLSDGSNVHRVYKVEFILCLKTGIGASINLIDEIGKVLANAWKRVIEVRFFDSNNTYIAHCSRARCLNLVSANKTRNNPWLYWTSRLSPTEGTLQLTRIDESDNLRDFQVGIILSSLKSEIGTEPVDIWLRIIVDSIQESQLSGTDKSTTPHQFTYKGFPQSSFTSASQTSTEHVATKKPTSSSAYEPEKYWRFRIVIFVLPLAVASFLFL